MEFFLNGYMTYNDDIYEILILYELLDNEILSDIRYGMKDVSLIDIHPSHLSFPQFLLRLLKF